MCFSESTRNFQFPSFFPGWDPRAPHHSGPGGGRQELHPRPEAQHRPYSQGLLQVVPEERRKSRSQAEEGGETRTLES